MKQAIYTLGVFLSFILIGYIGNVYILEYPITIGIISLLQVLGVVYIIKKSTE